MSERGTGPGDSRTGFGDLPYGGRQAAVFDKSLNVPSNTPTTDPEIVELEVPFSGVVPFIDLAWPDGAQSLAGIQVATRDGFNLLPFKEADGFISNNDYSNRYPLNFPVRDDDVVELQYANVDGTDHKVTAVVTVLELDGPR